MLHTESFQLIAFSFLMVLCSIIALPKYSYPMPDQKEQLPALVEVSEVLEEMVFTEIDLIGSSQPFTETIVASQEKGLVNEIRVDEGDYVLEKDLICKQDVSRLKLEIMVAESELAVAKITEARTKREFDRQSRLFSINSVSEKAYDDAGFESSSAQENVAILKGKLAILNDQLKKKDIFSPVSGYVLKRHALKGQWLSEGDPVVILIVLDPVRISVPVPEQYISFLNTGDAAIVEFDSLPGRIFEGKVNILIPLADKSARTFPVYIDIKNPAGAMKAGMLARVKLKAGNQHKAILVHKDSLVLSGSKTAVYVIKNGFANIIPIKTGPAHGSYIEVEGLLQPGMEVVVRGNERIMPGQIVKIIKKHKKSGLSEAFSGQTAGQP